jgi:glucose-6-phosphate isomerase
LSNLEYINLDQTKAYPKLLEQQKTLPTLAELFSEERIQNYQIINNPLTFVYATALINDQIINIFQELVEEQQVLLKYRFLRQQEKVNVSEKRAVAHHLVRDPHQKGIFYQEQQRITEFSQQVRTKEIKSCTNKAFKTIVQIGIGGSDLGPKAIYYALKKYVKNYAAEQPLLIPKFLSNIDPDGVADLLTEIDFESTLFLLVSKSGSTQETLANYEAIVAFANQAGFSTKEIKQHFVSITTPGSLIDEPQKFREIFYITSEIGGRFSATSAVGSVLSCLVFGSDIFHQFLKGAHLLDLAAEHPHILSNMTLLAALITIWERNFFGYPAKAIIPYSQGLFYFAQHLQQLECESNGKKISINNQFLNYHTAPIIIASQGTNCQHSFFQKIHQGTDVIPVQFITFLEPQLNKKAHKLSAASQTKLKANVLAQMIALAKGHENSNLNKKFPGNRPSTLIYADQLTPQTLGALFAFYENKVMFEGFLWNINSFDQEGVQLGKTITKDLLSNHKLSADICAFKNLLCI